MRYLYETRVIHCSSTDLLLEKFEKSQQELLRSMGDRGWRLVTVVSFDSCFFYYFEKEIESL